MQKYVAFISGLPFGRNAIKSDDLRSAMTRLGFIDVEVFSTSGNVAFDTAPVGLVGPLEAQISRHIKRTFELEDIWTFIRTPSELRSIVRELPYDEADVADEGNSIFVVLLSEEPDALTARRLRIKRNEVDELRLSRREIYWLRRRVEGEPIPPPPIADILDARATVRSLHTLQQIVAQLEKPRTKPRVKIEDSTQSERSRQ